MFNNNKITTLIKSYVSLTKPGIILGNLITAAAGFFLAAKGTGNYLLLLETLTGVSLVIGSGCVLNNYIDRSIDAKMQRTKFRVLVKGLISAHAALIYATILGLFGFLILTLFTNLLTVGIGLLGYFFYLVMYSIWKRRSDFGTIVGSISGAVAPVAGYCAVSNRFDLGALLLFLILVLWQMPHFYAIAIFRLKDYESASIPVLPVKKGILATKIHMLLYIIIFTITTLLLTVFKYTGYIYFVVAAMLGFIWLGLSIRGFTTNNTKLWARKMFLFSLVVLIMLCIMISINVKV